MTSQAYISTILVLFIVFVTPPTQYVVADQQGGEAFTNCGGVFEDTYGILVTPNFPGPYPTPIQCQWLIHAKPGKKIILYFTQYYMKDSFYVQAYQAYQDTSTYVGLQDYGEITQTHDDLLSIVAYQPYLLIQFNVDFIGNRHLRVIDHLLEVYGFNITYEIVDANANVSKETCSVKTCSYLGNCIVSADYKDFECKCFDEFFGDECQYGPYCDPDNQINACYHGGKCKYIFGSLINQCVCPKDYEGAYCERPVAGSNNYSIDIAQECELLQCSDYCDINVDNEVQCFCQEGYIMDIVNDTCIPQDRYRFDVSLDIVVGAPASLTDTELNETLHDLEDKLHDALIRAGLYTVTRLRVAGFRNTTERERGFGLTTGGHTTKLVLDFSFYCLVSERKQAPDAIVSIAAQGHLGQLTLNSTAKPKIEENPELILTQVLNYDHQPTLRGKMLTLVCAAKGSPNIKFQWYKDNVRVNTSLTLRNAWESIIPQTMHDIQLSVLNLDVVIPIDQGTFACEAIDFDDSQIKDIKVTVNNYPRVQLDPMSLSVAKGQTVKIKCLSPDDNWLKFTYEWFKNGELIRSNSQSEYYEEMFPTGVRLVVPAISQHAEYTCRVTNDAGSANVSAYVFVLTNNETAQFCPRDYEGQVMWSNTSCGHFDVKRCPTEQGGEHLSSSYSVGIIDVGYARRMCVCGGNGHNSATWSRPNFSKCQSLMLIKTYDQLELLRNGYQQTTLTAIFDDLYSFALTEKQDVILYSGDMDMVAGILTNLISHMKTFPQITIYSRKIDAQRLVDLISAILRRSSTATAAEKREIMVGPHIVRTIHTLLTGAIKYLSFPEYRSPSTDIIDLQVGRIPIVVASTDGDGGNGQTGDPHLVPHDIHHKRSQDSQQGAASKVDVYTMQTDLLADFLSYRTKGATKGSRASFIEVSRIYSVARVYEEVVAIQTKVRLSIPHNKPVSRYNQTMCFRWDFDPLNVFSGSWNKEACHTVESLVDKTICECSLPGHFIVGTVPSDKNEFIEDDADTDICLTLLIAYAIALLFTVITFVTFVRTFSMLPGDVYSIHLNFILGLGLYLIICLLCMVCSTDSKSASVVLRALVTYFVYVACTTLVIETFHIYLIIQNVKKFTLTKIKLFLGCWVIPLLITIPFGGFSKLADEQSSTHVISWLYTGTNQFYVFIVTIAIELIILTVLTVWSLITVWKWTEVWRCAERKTYIASIVKNSTLFLLLLLSTCSAINLETGNSVAHIMLHALFVISLSACLLLFRCILDKHIRFICRGIWCGLPRRKSADSKDQNGSSAFRAYMKPEQMTNVIVSQEQYNVSKYYDEVNRTKYTSARKKQLSALLGSSGSRESTSDTKSTSISFNSTNGSKNSTTGQQSLVDPNGNSSTESSGSATSPNAAPSSRQALHGGGASGGVRIAATSSENTDDVHNSTGNQAAGHSGRSGVNGRAAPITDDGDTSDTQHELQLTDGAVHFRPSPEPITLPWTQRSFISDTSDAPSLTVNGEAETHPHLYPRSIRSSTVLPHKKNRITNSKKTKKAFAEKHEIQPLCNVDAGGALCNGHVATDTSDSGNVSENETDVLLDEPVLEQPPQEPFPSLIQTSSVMGADADLSASSSS